MKKSNIILFLLGVLAFCSCDDMFAPADENTRQIDALYEESNYAHGLLIYAYDRLPYITTSQTDVATDDAVTNDKGSVFRNMTTGAWKSDNDPMSQWVNCKNGIQYANLFLTVVDKVHWAESAPSKQQMFIDRMTGEALTLRAILYYYLLQAHSGYADDGVLYGVPLLTEPEDGGSDFNQPRATFAACVKQCIDDCNKAIELLPADYVDIADTLLIPEKYRKIGANTSGYNLVLGSKSKGLISGKVAEAVKAQVALLAASPAFRDQCGYPSPSDSAAVYCAAVLKRIGGAEGLDATGNTWYKNKSKIDNGTEMPEILWRQDRAASVDQETNNFPPTLFGNGRINPSQNLVDAFPMANGYPISDSRSGYDPKNPYAGRDPRLDLAIIHHGSTFQSKVICTGVDMPNEDGNTNDNLNSSDAKATLTGYYLNKLLREDVSIDPAGKKTQYHIFPRIRYTELFLAFAEAANDAYGPTGHCMLKVDGKMQEFNLSAYDVIKAIRERAGLGKDMYGMPVGDKYLEECKGDKAKMTELIRNERRLELCFENKRFWDLRRWMLPLNEAIRGMKVELDPSKDDGSLLYTPFQVEGRDFDSSYQWYGPIPMNEVLKWSNLKQNKGWD